MWKRTYLAGVLLLPALALLFSSGCQSTRDVPTAHAMPIKGTRGSTIQAVSVDSISSFEQDDGIPTFGGQASETISQAGSSGPSGESPVDPTTAGEARENARGPEKASEGLDRASETTSGGNLSHGHDCPSGTLFDGSSCEPIDFE